MAESTSRTTTRKPRTKAAVSGETTPAPVRRASRKPAPASTAQPVRKAPTSISRQSRRPVIAYVSIGIFVLLFGISAVIGMNAEGQINVANTIVAQGDQRYVSPDGTPVTMPSQSNERIPNSGLVPSSQQPANTPPPPPVETASSSDVASSTDPAASSTEETAPAAPSEGEVAGESTTAEEPAEAPAQ